MRWRRLAAVAGAVLVAYGCGTLANTDDGPSPTTASEAGSARETGSTTVVTDAGGDAGCQPKTCAELGANCGSVPDMCGGEIPDCGTCSGATPNCGGNGPNKCGAAPCEAGTCQKGQCGTVSNGCGGTMDCGGCSGLDYCDGTGKCQHLCVQGGSCGNALTSDCSKAPAANNSLLSCSGVPNAALLPSGCYLCTKPIVVAPYDYCCP